WYGDQHGDLLRALPNPVVCATSVLYQRRSLDLLRCLDVAGCASGLRRMRGAGHVQLGSPQGRPGRLSCVGTSRPRRAPAVTTSAAQLDSKGLSYTAVG